MKNQKLRILVFLALMTAIIFISTFFLKLPVTNGYVHLGDGMIFLASICVGYIACIPAILGSCMADLFGGYMVYAPVSFVVKGLMSFIAALAYKKNSQDKFYYPKNIILFVFAETLMILGYFVFEYFFYGASAATVGIAFNLTQGITGVIAGIFMIPFAQKIKTHFTLY